MAPVIAVVINNSTNRMAAIPHLLPLYQLFSDFFVVSSFTAQGQAKQAWNEQTEAAEGVINGKQMSTCVSACAYFTVDMLTPVLDQTWFHSVCSKQLPSHPLLLPADSQT